MGRDMAIQEGGVSFPAEGVGCRRVLETRDDVRELTGAALGDRAGPDIPLAAASPLNPSRGVARRPHGKQGGVIEPLFEIAL